MEFDDTDLAVDLHKVFVDEESYNHGHGHGYEVWGVDKSVGALVIVRPDQRKYSYSVIMSRTNFLSDVAMVTAIDDYKGVGDFFSGFALPRNSS